MARPFVLPDLGEGLTEAEIVRVFVGEGDTIAEDAPLLEVETDKATVEIPSPFGGRVERVHVQPGQTVRVGEVLVTFADAVPTTAPAGGGRGAPSTAPTPTRGGPAPPSPAARPAPVGERGALGAPTAPSPTPAAADERGAPPAAVVALEERRREGPVPAAPSTRRLARELGVDLRAVRGTGRGGRVTDDDVRAAAAAGPLAPPAAVSPRPAGPEVAPERPAVARPLAPVLEAPPLPDFARWGPVERRPLSHLRRTIAERMTLAAALIPHVTHFDRADITDLDALIQRNLEAGRARGVTLTLTPFLLKAAALALREHPQFNASLDPAAGELIVKGYCHLGVAVATDRGLIVPVIRDVDRKPLLELQRELAALAERVRAGRATLEDLRGGCFTITNVGALGGTGAVPIINYPEVAILGVARARLEPVVREGRVVPRLLLPLTLTFDHRVADGADGARFAAAIVQRLEAPERLLLDW